MSPEQFEFFQSIAPHSKIPNYRIGDLNSGAVFSLENGKAAFEFDALCRAFRYSFDQAEPPKNLLWMLLPVLERLHSESGRFTVHSTAFARGGKGVMIVGETHSGKTSCLLRAMQRGYSGISGEHTLVSDEVILGGTKAVEFFSGLANRMPHLRQHLDGVAIGWEKSHRIKTMMTELGATSDFCPLSMVVFPMVTDEQQLQVIQWTPRKKEIELYKKFSEMIRAFNSFLYNNSEGFPSLDSTELSRVRMAAVRKIVSSRRFLVLKGRAEDMLDVIDRELEGV